MLKTFHLVDGYVLNTPDGYNFSTNWVDLLNAVELSVSVVFVGGTPGGTLQLYASNDQPESVNGFYPKSAASRTGAALDSSPLASPVTISTAGVTRIDVSNICVRWFQVVFTASSMFPPSALTVMYNARSSNA